jgi:NAD(P)-dependent dehydrogenase (short-subunit alcohol dehydrogenase family)
MALLDGRVCIVTGAGRGIGREHALALARRGARVIVNDPGVAVDGSGSDNTPAEQVVTEIKNLGGEALADYADVSDWTQSEKLIERAFGSWGKLDVLINNAGILRDRIIWNMTEQDWDSVMRVHMKGAFNCTRHATARWRAAFKEHGKPLDCRIINTVSGAMFGNTGQSNYAAAKAGVMGFTISVALEVASMGITCNAVRPGGQTRMSSSIPTTGALAELAAKAREQAKEKPKDAPATYGSELVAYLASVQASFVSGQLLQVRQDRLEIDQGWQPRNVLKNKGGAPWTAEDIVTGMMKLVGTGPIGLVEFLGQG